MPAAARRLTLFLDSLAAGGAQRQIAVVAAGMAAAAWQVELAWYNDSARFHEVPAGVTPHLLPRRARTDPRFVPALAGLVARRRTDLVHAWLPAPALYACMAALLPGSARVIAGVRCSPSLFVDSPAQGQMTRLAAHMATAVTVNSRSMRDWLLAARVPERKVHFIGNVLTPGIAARQPATPAQRRALLTSLGLDPEVAPIVALGRFDAFKNQDGLVRALLRLRGEGAQVPPLLLAGLLEDTARVQAVRQLAQQGGWPDVHVVPAVADVPTLLEAAQFSVLASRSEGTPNVVLEGLGLGTLVVATRVGEVPDLIADGQTGLLCNVDDEVDLARALRRALNMLPAERRAIGQRARADVLARFGHSVVLAQYAALYERVLA